MDRWGKINMIHATQTNIWTDKVIVDNEISNDIRNEDPRKDWHYDKAKLTVVGILYHNEMTQIVLEQDEETFKQQIKEALLQLPQPFYAFNKHMEQGNFKGYIGEDYQIEEIKPFMGRGWTKAKFYQEIVGMGLAQPLQDPFNDNSALAISEWAKGNKKGVMAHNQNCLLKEAMILQHSEALRNKYADKLDEKGWLQ